MFSPSDIFASMGLLLGVAVVALLVALRWKQRRRHH